MAIPFGDGAGDCEMAIAMICMNGGCDGALCVCSSVVSILDTFSSNEIHAGKFVSENRKRWIR